MRFTTELLPLLAGQPGLIVEVTGEPADYREAGDSLRIAVSTDEVAGDTRLVRPRRDDHRRGPRGAVRSRCSSRSAAASRICCCPTAPTSRLDKPELQALRPADRGGPGAAGLARRPAADQPVPGRALGRAGRAGRDRRTRRRPGGEQVQGAAVSSTRRPSPSPPAGLRAAAAPLPARRVRLAGVPVGAPARRDPRRRHGARQDAAVPRPDQPRPGARPGGGPVPDRRADQRRGELGRRGRAVRPGPDGGAVTGTLARRGRATRASSSRAPTSSSRPTRCCASTSTAYAEVGWSGLLLDEAQHAKNRQSKIYQCARAAGRAVQARDHRHAAGEQPDGAVVAAVDHGARAVPEPGPVPRVLRQADRTARRHASGWPSCGAGSSRWSSAAPRSRSPPTCRPSRSRCWRSSCTRSTASSTRRGCSASGRRSSA